MASAIDEDTKRTVAAGRATVGSVLSSAKHDLRKAFLVFVFGFLGTFYALQMFVWDRLKADLYSYEEIRIIAITPFDVILLQVKIGVAVGILLALPVVVYYGRDALRARGWWPAEDVPRWKLAIPATLAVLLFLGGLSYAYFLFFPLMLDFLAANAANAGVQPSWSIVKWAQFVAFLSLSFGLAAQLPLTMSGLAYLRIVSYETFRDKWRYAVVIIFVFGALFSPPDPITQIMWAIPLCGLYAFSLALTRFAQLLRRSTEEVSPARVATDNWNVLAGTAVLTFAAAFFFFTRGGVAAVNDALASLPESVRPPPLPGVDDVLGLDPRLAAGLVAAAVTAVALAVAVFVLATRELDESAPATAGEPADIDIASLDAGAIHAAPPEAFEEMSEEEALELASEAMEEDDPDKAEAILDRWDEVDQQSEGGEDSEAAAAAGAAGEATSGETVTGETAGGGAGGDEGGVITSTTAGVMDAFTEEETTEEDVGGYYYDLAFILESITSRAFRIVGLFMAVMAVTFVALYKGGIGYLRETFLKRMPEAMAEKVDVVALHPVEVLIFNIKVSTLFAVVVTLPLVLYYLWPALKERGFVRGDPRVFLAWGVTLLVGIVGGSLVGFFYVAPAIISWLATDALNAHMVIHYRINTAGWLVIFTTVGIGLLVEIPITMILFHRGGIVSFSTMFDRWRTIVMAIFVTAALVTPSSLLTMLLFGIPVSIAFLVGLGVLWLYTLGGRRTVGREGKGESEAAD